MKKLESQRLEFHEMAKLMWKKIHVKLEFLKRKPREETKKTDHL